MHHGSGIGTHGPAPEAILGAPRESALAWKEFPRARALPRSTRAQGALGAAAGTTLVRTERSYQ